MAGDPVFTSRRLVLRDSVSPDEVELLAKSLGWQLACYVKRDADRGIDFSATWRADDVTSVHFIEDDYAQERYFVVSGSAYGQVEEVLNDIEAGIAVWSLDEMLLEVDGNIYPASKAKAVLRLGLGAPLEAVDSVLGRILTASRNPEPRVRRRAVRAIAYTPWPGYRERLEEIAEGDPDETTAREAGVLLRALADHALDQTDRT